MASNTPATNDSVRLYREKEIKFLQNLQGVIHQAKQELNNDLTRLALKSMPMMMMSTEEQNQQVVEEVIIEDNDCGLSVTSNDYHAGTDQSPSKKQMQELEPLDLDI